METAIFWNFSRTSSLKTSSIWRSPFPWFLVPFIMAVPDVKTPWQRLPGKDSVGLATRRCLPEKIVTNCYKPQTTLIICMMQTASQVTNCIAVSLEVCGIAIWSILRDIKCWSCCMIHAWLPMKFEVRRALFSIFLLFLHFQTVWSKLLAVFYSVFF